MIAPYRSEPGWDGRRWTGEYADYLKTEWWAIARRWALVTQRFTCQDCRWIQGDGGRWLEVHHRTYERLGDECHGDLEVLCNECHNIRHGFAPRPAPTVTGHISESMGKYWDKVIANLRPTVAAGDR